MTTGPSGELDPRYGDPSETARPWSDAEAVLHDAELYWLSTVRPDGRPHVTPLIGLWLDGAMYFATSEVERKNRNIEQNPRCTFTTGCNKWNEGFDVILEGEAKRVSDTERLQQIADAFLGKYGDPWRFEVLEDGYFEHGRGGPRAIVYEVKPETVFGFGKGPHSQTRWRL